MALAYQNLCYYVPILIHVTTYFFIRYDFSKVVYYLKKVKTILAFSFGGVIFWRSIFQKPDFLWQKITLLHYYGLDTTYYYGKKYAVVGDNSDGYEAKTASLAYKPMKQLGFSGSIGSCFIHIHLHPCLSICMFECVDDCTVHMAIWLDIWIH